MRVAEERARESNAGAAETLRPARGAARGAHPDQEQAAQDIAEALGGALGAEVRVKPARDGSTARSCPSRLPQEAIELARRIAARAACLGWRKLALRDSPRAPAAARPCGGKMACSRAISSVG